MRAGLSPSWLARNQVTQPPSPNSTAKSRSFPAATTSLELTPSSQPVSSSHPAVSSATEGISSADGVKLHDLLEEGGSAAGRSSAGMGSDALSAQPQNQGPQGSDTFPLGLPGQGRTDKCTEVSRVGRKDSTSSLAAVARSPDSIAASWHGREGSLHKGSSMGNLMTGIKVLRNKSELWSRFRQTFKIQGNTMNLVSFPAGNASVTLQTFMSAQWTRLEEGANEEGGQAAGSEPNHVLLFVGLRVRMGMVTGVSGAGHAQLHIAQGFAVTVTHFMSARR